MTVFRRRAWSKYTIRSGKANFCRLYLLKMRSLHERQHSKHIYKDTDRFKREQRSSVTALKPNFVSNSMTITLQQILQALLRISNTWMQSLNVSEYVKRQSLDYLGKKQRTSLEPQVVRGEDEALKHYHCMCQAFRILKRRCSQLCLRRWSHRCGSD